MVDFGSLSSDRVFVGVVQQKYEESENGRQKIDRELKLVTSALHSMGLTLKRLQLHEDFATRSANPSSSSSSSSVSSATSATASRGGSQPLSFLALKRLQQGLFS